MRARQVWFGRRLPVVIAAAWLMLPASALGCPRCATGAAARAMAFGPAFWPNLLAVSSPFILLAAVTLACARIGSPRVRGSEERS